VGQLRLTPAGCSFQIHTDETKPAARRHYARAQVRLIQPRKSSARTPIRATLVLTYTHMAKSSSWRISSACSTRRDFNVIGVPRGFLEERQASCRLSNLRVPKPDECRTSYLQRRLRPAGFESPPRAALIPVGMSRNVEFVPSPIHRLARGSRVSSKLIQIGLAMEAAGSMFGTKVEYQSDRYGPFMPWPRF